MSDMRLAWGNKVDDEFKRALVGVCKDLNWTQDHASWLMACISFETAGTFDPAIRNKAGSGATGLIQFMPRTAEGLGTTTDVLAMMDARHQFHFVKKYFKPYAERIKSLSDMYMAILAPKAVGKGDDFVLYSSGAAYRMNSSLDVNSDGEITKEEASRFVESRHQKGWAFGNWTQVAWGDSIQDIVARIESDLELLKSTIGDRS